MSGRVAKKKKALRRCPSCGGTDPDETCCYYCHPERFKTGGQLKRVRKGGRTTTHPIADMLVHQDESDGDGRVWPVWIQPPHCGLPNYLLKNQPVGEFPSRDTYNQVRKYISDAVAEYVASKDAELAAVRLQIVEQDVAIERLGVERDAARASLANMQARAESAEGVVETCDRAFAARGDDPESPMRSMIRIYREAAQSAGGEGR